MSAFCSFWLPTNPSRGDTSRQWLIGWSLKLSQLSDILSNNFQFGRKQPVRRPDGATLQQPRQSLGGGGGLWEQSLWGWSSSVSGQMLTCSRRSQMLQEKSVGRGRLYIRGMSSLTVKYKSTHRINLSYSWVTSEDQTTKQLLNGLGIIWTFRYLSAVLGQDLRNRL